MQVHKYGTLNFHKHCPRIQTIVCWAWIFQIIHDATEVLYHIYNLTCLNAIVQLIVICLVLWCIHSLLSFCFSIWSPLCCCTGWCRYIYFWSFSFFKPLWRPFLFFLMRFIFETSGPYFLILLYFLFSVSLVLLIAPSWWNGISAIFSHWQRAKNSEKQSGSLQDVAYVCNCWNRTGMWSQPSRLWVICVLLRTYFAHFDLQQCFARAASIFIMSCWQK